MYLIHSRQEIPADKMYRAVANRQAILDAVKLHDPEGAAAAAIAHGESIRIRWRDLYPEAQQVNDSRPSGGTR
jgi:DNA-binding FadR family transcriptional regulator